MEPLLHAEKVDLWFGGNHALSDVSLAVDAGQVLGIIGPNGAGKTSLLNCLNGFYRPKSGRVVFDGLDLTKKRPHQIARLGLGRTFQNVHLQPEASVLENILLGANFRMKANILAACLYWGPARAEEERERAEVEDVISFLEMEHLRDRPVGVLPWGQQKLVEIARALVMKPKVLLLDEPSSGMNREEKEDIARFIVRMKHELGLTQILIEHDARFVADLCDRVVALDFGVVIASGTPTEVLNDPKVIDAYVGSNTASASTA